MSNEDPKPRDPSPAISRVTAALEGLGDASLAEDFAEVVIALGWATRRAHRREAQLKAAGIDPDAGDDDKPLRQGQ